jgi:hypothetical protein
LSNPGSPFKQTQCRSSKAPAVCRKINVKGLSVWSCRH